MTAEEKWNVAIQECGAELTSKYYDKEFYLALGGENVKLFFLYENRMGPWDEDSPYGMILLPPLETIRKNDAFRDFINANDGYSQGCMEAYSDWFDGKTDECPLDGDDLYDFVQDYFDEFDTVEYTIYDNDLVKKTVKYAIYIDVDVPENADDDDIRQAAMDKAQDHNYNIFEDGFFEEIQ